MANTYDHIFFDLDKTLTESRSLRDARMQELLSALSKRKSVGVISGASESQMKKQIPELADGGMYLLSQNGGTAYDESGELLWQHVLSDENEREILEHIEKMRVLNDETDIDEDDLIDHRGSQIGFSFIGHNADKERKNAFDPDGSKRAAYLAQEPFESDEIDVRIGGTTTLDYIAKGYDKGGSLTKLMQEKGITKEQCVYIGDALFAGGNDEAVIGIMDTVHTCGPAETCEIIERLLYDD